MPTDLEIMKLHAAALYLCDNRGRMVDVNGVRGGTVPRFFLGRTADGNVVRFRGDLPDELVAELEQLCLRESGKPGADPVQASGYLKLLSEHSPVQEVAKGPTYIFDTTSPPTIHETVPVTKQNIDILLGGLDAWREDLELGRPMAAIVQDGRAVSVCASVRLTPEAHEAGVETLATHRGRGYAAAACSHWAGTIHRNGVTALYSTSWKNRSSQRVAERLGLRQYGVTFQVT